MGEGGRSQVSLVPGRGRHRVGRRPREAFERPVDVHAHGEIVELAIAGALLHVGGDGRMLILGGDAQLRLIDAQGAPVSGFRAPAWMKLRD